MTDDVSVLISHATASSPTVPSPWVTTTCSFSSMMMPGSKVNAHFFVFPNSVLVIACCTEAFLCNVCSLMDTLRSNVFPSVSPMPPSSGSVCSPVPSDSVCSPVPSNSALRFCTSFSIDWNSAFIPIVGVFNDAVEVEVTMPTPLLLNPWLLAISISPTATPKLPTLSASNSSAANGMLRFAFSGWWRPSYVLLQHRNNKQQLPIAATPMIIHQNQQIGPHIWHSLSPSPSPSPLPATTPPADGPGLGLPSLPLDVERGTTTARWDVTLDWNSPISTLPQCTACTIVVVSVANGPSYRTELKHPAPSAAHAGLSKLAELSV